MTAALFGLSAVTVFVVGAVLGYFAGVATTCWADSAPIADAPTDPPSDQFPVTYDPGWEADQRRQARADMGIGVE